MSEQQSGAGYPQPTSGQPGQQPYAQAPYASPQAQYQAQQQYAAYAPPAPSLFDKLGVASMPAILGLSGLGALVLSGLISGTSDGTDLQVDLSIQLLSGVPSVLSAVIVTFALALFGGEKLRPLWKSLTLAGSAVFLAGLLYDLLSLPDGDSAADASAWIGALLLVGAYALFTTGALLVPGSATAPVAAPAAPAYPTGQQPAVPPAAPQTQQSQWPQAPQQ